MSRTPLTCLLIATFFGTAALPVRAQEGTVGYLCCNLRSDGSWISDANYAEPGKFIVPMGTRVLVRGLGRQRVHIELDDGRRMALGNDYSRDLELEAFQGRYIVREDPRKSLATLPATMRNAIYSARVMLGMSREQVAMALGWPITSENPRPEANVWRYWLGSFEPFQVYFDEAGRVRLVEGAAQTLQRVFLAQ
ncbi:MAG: hypothetical protein JNJ89_13800 [Rubrivivax sp.]|nr:hypothetical protein [Rubrivivax sp.]